MFNKLKQIKDLRSQAKKVQNVLEQETVHADACGGKVNVIMDGTQKIMAVEIHPDLFSLSEREKVQDGIKEAVNGASKKIQHMMAQKMRSGELKMPDIGNLS
jgi:DNA-binding protein YbaB